MGGGIPELLASEDLVEPGNVNALADLIEKVVSDPERQLQMSARNLERSREYADDVLRTRRLDFYRHVKHATERHLSSNGVNARSGQRALDFVLALFALVAVCPLLLPLAFVIRLSLGSPVLFRQLRPGLKGRLFTMYKFRTMREAFDSNGKLLPDSEPTHSLRPLPP